VDNPLSDAERIKQNLSDFFRISSEGVLKSGEGITDYFKTIKPYLTGIQQSLPIHGNSSTTSITSLPDYPTINQATNEVKYDWSGEQVKDWTSQNKDSWWQTTSLGNKASGIVFSAGEMLPLVAVSLVTSGLGAAAGATTGTMSAVQGGVSALNLIGESISSAGQSAESALNNGANLGQAALYGTASGIVEGATEMIGGEGITNAFLPKNTLIKNTGGTIASRVLKGAISEGVEEVMGESVQPFLDAIYTGKIGSNLEGNTFGEKMWSQIKNMGEAGLAGAITALPFSMTSQITNFSRVENYSSLIDENIKRANTTTDLDKRSEYLYNLQNYYSKLENELGNMKEESRSYLLQETNNFNGAFDDSGKLKDDYKGQKITSSASATLSEEKIKTDLTQLSKDYSKLRNADIAFNYAGELNETEKKNVKKFMKALAGLKEKTGQTINYVITNSVDGFNASQIGNTIYIAQDQFDSDAWEKALPHETTHIIEGNEKTQEYRDYSNSLLSILQKDGVYTEEGQKVISSLVDRGYFTQNEINHVFETNIEDYTSKDFEVISSLVSELPAVQSERILGNENFIKRISSSDSIIGKVMTMLDNLKLKKNLSQEEYKTYNSIYNKYIKALESLGKTWKNGKIMGKDEEPKYSTKDTFNVNILNYKGKQYSVLELRNELKKERNAQLFNSKALTDIELNINKTDNKSLLYLNKIYNGNIPGKVFESIQEMTMGEDNIVFIARTRDRYYQYSLDEQTIKEGINKIADEMKAVKQKEIGNIEQEKQKEIERKKKHEENVKAVADKLNISTNDYLKLIKISSNIDNYNEELSKGYKENQTRTGYVSNRESSRSIEAKINGEYPLSVASKIFGVSSETIKNNFEISSWHHTSAMMNQTDYYDLSSVVDTINNISNGIYDEVLGTKSWDKTKTFLGIDELENEPTKFSLNDTKNEELVSRFDNLSSLDISKQFAAQTQAKVYQENQIKRALLEIFDNTLVKDGNRIASLTQVQEKALANYLTVELNSQSLKVNKEDIANRMADYIIENAETPSTKFKNYLSSEELEGLRNTLREDILSILNNKTTQTLKDRYNELVIKMEDTLKRTRACARATFYASRLKDLKSGLFVNSSVYHDPVLEKIILKLSRIDIRGTFNESGTRKIISELNDWYSEDNNVVNQSYSEEIKDMLEEIATGEGELETGEINDLSTICCYFKNFIETFNKIIVNGKYVDAVEIAKLDVGIINMNNERKRTTWYQKAVRSGLVEKYSDAFNDPMSIARRADHYHNGFYTSTLNEFREGTINASVMEMRLKKDVEAFYKDNKGYIKHLSSDTVELNGVKLPLRIGMSLMMTMPQPDSWKGLVYSGYTYYDEKNNRIENAPLGSAESYTDEDIKNIVSSALETLKKQMSDLDMKYVRILQDVYNNQCKQEKAKTDIIKLGYSNIKEGYYYPLSRDNIAKSIDSDNFMDEMGRVSSKSFNKDRITNRKALLIRNVDQVFDRHVKGISQYANLAIPFDNFNRLYNLDISGNKNKPRTIKTESQTSWKGADNYLSDLVKDMQGMNKGDKFSQIVSRLRGSMAVYQLGANPKIWFTQFASILASWHALPMSSIVKGIGINSSDVDTYCSLAELRNYDQTVVKAEGVLDQVSSVGKYLMKGIGTFDRIVIQRVFGACQVEVERTKGLKIGTTENKVEAGKMLHNVILETQQNAFATDRSMAMRSSSQLAKTLTMFTSDIMKSTGRVIDAIGALDQFQSDLSIDPTNTELQNQVKTAKIQLCKSLGSLTLQSIYIALVGLLFRALYNKTDEDEVKTTLFNVLGNMIGGLPLIKEVYNYFTDGYEIQDMSITALNDVLESVKALATIADGKEVPKKIKNVLYGISELTGIPLRNIYNLTTGLTRRLSPATGYKIDDFFGTKYYTSDLNKALENGQDKLAETIIGCVLETNTSSQSKAVSKELNRLYQLGFKSLPIATPDTVNGNKLTAKQIKTFESVYSKATDEIESVIAYSSYISLGDESKSNVIKSIYSTYYDLALSSLGEVKTKNVLFSYALDTNKFALIIAEAKSLTADYKNGVIVPGSKKAKVQKYINGLKLSAVQKYMIMGYLGYSNSNGLTDVKKYINSLELTNEEKKILLGYSGY